MGASTTCDAFAPRRRPRWRFCALALTPGLACADGVRGQALLEIDQAVWTDAIDRDKRNYTRPYSEASNIVFRIRLYLGTLGGMVVAWFLTPEAADGLFRTLSPFALAFLAGYSVELLFAAMDKLIAAFTNK